VEKLRILIVEDHYATLEGLVGGLSRETEFEIVGGCADSDEGLALADRERPQIIVLDLHVPGKLKPIAMITEFLRFPERRLIVFSAESRLAYVQSILALGVSAYLLKSERVSKVSDTIRQVSSGASGIVSSEITRDFKKITPSENEVLHMLGKGMKYQEIADLRCTSVPTARKQCEILLLKLDLQNREQLIAWAVQNGYGSDDLG